MDAVVKLVLFFFVTLLSFSVGTYVGKQVSDAEYRKTALESEPGSNSRNPSSVEEEHHEEKAEAKADAHGEHASNEEKSESLTQKELDQLAEEFSHQSETERNVASESSEEGHDAKVEKKDAHGYKSFERGAKKETAPAHEAKAPAHEAAPAKKETAKVEPKAEKAEAPKAESRNPSSLPSVAENATGKFTLQVGSYPSEKDAQEKAKELKAKGWNAFYINADVKGQKWYRLNVGLFSSLKGAQDFKKEFSKETKNNNVLIQKITQ